MYNSKTKELKRKYNEIDMSVASIQKSLDLNQLIACECRCPKSTVSPISLTWNIRLLDIALIEEIIIRLVLYDFLYLQWTYLFPQ